MVVTGKYQRFIPLFCYFCASSYPEYAIRIFLDGKMEGYVKKSLRLLNGLGDIRIVEFGLGNLKGRVPHEIKSLRWIMNPNEYEGFDNIYLGDIDIMIVKEPISLEDQHIQHCIKCGLSYSNSVRPKTQRLSGLHFIRRQQYFDSIKNIRIEYQNAWNDGLLKKEKNENVLYKIIEESGIGFPKGWFRPHHGIHLGIWRSKEVWGSATENLHREEYEKTYIEFMRMQQSKLFKEIFSLCPLKELKRANINLSKLGDSL
jgi:hypothetical protein